MASKKAKRYVTVEQMLAANAPLTLSQVLQHLRRLRNVKQVDMSKALGISAQNLCDIEKGRRLVSATCAARFAKALQLPVNKVIQYALQQMIDQAELPYVVSVNRNN